MNEIIKTIHITNFQSHKDTELELTPGVNVLIGPSYAGKSAILRAVEWAMKNQPAGDPFRSNWCKSKDLTKVTIKTETDTISRIKNKTINEYSLNGEIYRAFGQGVPEDIAKILNVSEINFQKQIDMPFLLTATSGEVARYLNRIVDLDVIDRAHTNIEAIRRKTNAALIVYKSSLKDSQADLKENFSDLKDRESGIHGLDRIEKESNGLKQKLIRLFDLSNAITRENQSLAPLVKRTKAEKKVNELIRLNQSLSETRQRQRTIEYLLEEISSKETALLDYSKIIKAEKQANRLQQLMEKIQLLEQQRDGLSGYVRLISEAQERIERKEGEISSMSGEFNRLMPDICPLCEKADQCPFCGKKQ